MSYEIIRSLASLDHRMLERFRVTWWGRILSEHQTEPTELLMGGFLKWVVGTWLFLPFDSFASSPTFATLQVIGQEFPEYLIAIILMTLGAFHMLALRSGIRTLRRRSSFIGAIIWFSLAFTFIWNNPAAFGATLFFVASVCQSWCYLRLRR